MKPHRTLIRNVAVLGLLAAAGLLGYAGWRLGRGTLPAPVAAVTIVTATRDPGTPTANPYPYPAWASLYPPHSSGLEATPYVPPPTVDFVAPTPIPMQVYVDASGQFTLTLPADWKPGDEPGSFAGTDGYAKAHFLPEVGYVGSILDVCERVARMPQYVRYIPTLGDQHVQSLNCELRSPANLQWVHVRVIRNNSPDPQQRYLLLEADLDHFAKISAGLVVRYPQPANEYGEEPLPPAPLSAADRAFWEEIPSLPGLSIIETVLENLPPGGPYEWGGSSSAATILRDRRRTPTAGDPTPSPTPLPEVRLQQANAVLRRFGFRLKAGESSAQRYALDYDDREVLKDIESFGDPFLSDSGGDFGLPVRIYHQEDCLVRNHDLDCWNTLTNRQVVGGPFFIGDRLYWAVWNTGTHRVEVWSDKMVVFTFAGTYTIGPPGRLTRWGNDWLLEVNNTVILSGEILNDALGYEEIFNWQLVDGQPVYFFRKGPRVGISYRGTILPVYYERVVSGTCCGLANYNPRIGPGGLEFFAFHDGTWYFVELKLPGSSG